MMLLVVDEATLQGSCGLASGSVFVPTGPTRILQMAGGNVVSHLGGGVRPGRALGVTFMPQ